MLASGDPRVGQVQITIDMSAGADASASGGGEASASVSVTQPKSQPYGYAAIRPTKLDPQGRIVAFASWPVLCGPPPPKDKDGNDTAMATLHPLPGIEMKPGDAVLHTAQLPGCCSRRGEGQRSLGRQAPVGGSLGAGRGAMRLEHGAAGCGAAWRRRRWRCLAPETG